MALWGNQDSKTATGTVSITTAGAVTGSSTAFTTEAKIGNTIKVGSDEYVIVAIASDTACTVTSGINGGAMAQKTGQSYTLSEKPAFVAKSESKTTSGDSGDSTKVFGVDTTEAAQAEARAQGVAHAGWVRRTTGSGGRAGRVFTEVLVAGGSITGDAEDDAVFPDRTITITEQPQNISVVEPDTATFSVTATVSPTASLTYQWQYSVDSGDNWINLGANDPTLTITSVGDAYVDGTEIRVVVSSTGATSVTSTTATLTVTAE